MTGARRERAMYDLDGQRWREYRRSMRMRHGEPRTRDWAIPIVVAAVLLTVVGLLLDPTGMFSLR